MSRNARMILWILVVLLLAGGATAGVLYWRKKRALASGLADLPGLAPGPSTTGNANEPGKTSLTDAENPTTAKPGETTPGTPPRPRVTVTVGEGTVEREVPVAPPRPGANVPEARLTRAQVQRYKRIMRAIGSESFRSALPDNGDKDAAMLAAVRRFQTAYNLANTERHPPFDPMTLTADGVLGPRTQRALEHFAAQAGV